MSLDMQEFAEFLRAVREQSKISIQDFAHMCGISTAQNIGRIELGKVTAPSFDTMERILRVINQLDIIQDNTFSFDGYSENLINTIKRYREDSGEDFENRPSGGDMLEDLVNASRMDTEIAFAIVALIKEYPVFRSELLRLSAAIEENITKPERMDYADVINDLTKRGNTAFYFGLNDKIRKIVRTRSCTHVYEFMAMLVQALCDSAKNYADKDGPELSHSERQVRGARRSDAEPV